MKNIVFDIGNVLVDYRPKEFLGELGLSEDICKRIIKASVMNPCWEQFERAAITEQEAIDGFVAADPEIKTEIEAAFKNINGMLTLRDYAVDWIKSLKESGFGVYYLSNYSHKAYKECSETLTFIPLTDGGLLSFQAKMTKPDPEFYKLFLNKFDLNAEDCIFVDDTPKNVEAAEKLGFKGICFDNWQDVDRKIRGMA